MTFLQWLLRRKDKQGTETKPEPVRIGVALGSGAAWGVAHVGVLKVLDEIGVPISLMSGSSAGSLVGALYAAGIRGEELVRHGKTYGWRDAGRLNYFPRISLATNEKMIAYLRNRIGSPNFSDLKIPFYVVATNLNTGQLRVFNEGSVLQVVQASCALPGIFAPVEIEGELYCDGGVLNKVPCRVLREAGADFVIGVELGNGDRYNKPENIYDVIVRALEIAMRDRVQHELDAADLVIRPDSAGVKAFDFDRNEFLIRQGERAAREAIEASERFPDVVSPMTQPEKPA